MFHLRDCENYGGGLLLTRVSAEPGVYKGGNDE